MSNILLKCDELYLTNDEINNIKNIEEMNKNKLNKNLTIYFNNKEYLNSETNFNSIFINSYKLELNKNKLKSKYLISLTYNSLNPNFTNFKKIKEIDIEFIKENINFNKKLKYKLNGNIIICLNNFLDYYTDNFDISYFNKLLTVIRTYKDNKIKIILNKTKNTTLDNKLNNIIKNYKNILITTECNWNNIIKKCYCVFINNSYLIFELIAHGIPVFNLSKLYKSNYFPKTTIHLDYFNKIDEIIFDRENIYKKYFSKMIFFTKDIKNEDELKIEIKNRLPEIINKGIYYFNNFTININALKLKYTDEDLDDIFKYYKYLKNDLTVYFELKENNSQIYVNNKLSSDSIFIRGGRLTLCQNRIKFNKVLIYSFNSYNINHTNFDKIKNKSTKFVKNHLIFNETIKYKEDGDIIIYLPNLKGWFEKYINVDKINDLIRKIRKYKNNRIILKLHPYQAEKTNRAIKTNGNILNQINQIIKKYDNIIIGEQIIRKNKKLKEYWNDIIKNCYCVFIQNAFFLFELIALGIPVFNLGKVLSLNYYPDCSIPLKYLSNINEYNFNRKFLLKKYLSTCVFLPLDDANDKYKYKKPAILNIIKNNINYFN